MTSNTDWDQRFFDLATQVSTWSKDPNKKVGAVIVRPDNTVSSVGYNGFPRGVNDTTTRLLYKPVKNLLMVHAEANAIVSSKDPDLVGHTLYCNEFCCCACAGLVIQKGISRIVVPTLNKESSWFYNFLEAREMLHEAGVHISYWPRSRLQ
jgi:dCMP deaminase